MINSLKPDELNYRMPAEWEKHEATWLSWPHGRLPYWGERLSGVEDVYVQMIEALHGSEKVHLAVPDGKTEQFVRRKLDKAGVSSEHVVFYGIRTLDVWMRDYGPIFVVNDKGKTAITHWTFNGWGQYNDLVRDSSVPAKIHEITGLPYFNAGLVLEGGSIEVNGKGALVATKQCLLNKNRNPYEQDLIEPALKGYLGVRDIVWLNEGLFNDDTAGHIDNLVRFVDASTVLCVRESSVRDKNYYALKENLEAMSNERFDVVSLPMPGRVCVDRQRRSASYANFYIANNVVLAPVFGKRRDANAIGILREHFPSRKVVPINCLDLIASGGAIHCVTQQQPV